MPGFSVPWQGGGGKDEGWDSGKFPAKTAASPPCDGAFGAEQEEQSPGGGGCSSSSASCFSACQLSGENLVGGFYFALRSLTAFPPLLPMVDQWIGLRQGWAQSPHPQQWLNILPGAGPTGLLTQASCLVSRPSLKASSMDLKVFSLPQAGAAASPGSPGWEGGTSPGLAQSHRDPGVLF